MFAGIGSVLFVQVSGVYGFAGGATCRVISCVSQGLVPKFVPIAARVLTRRSKTPARCARSGGLRTPDIRRCDAVIGATAHHKPLWKPRRLRNSCISE